jgi:hypothetical protein
VNAADKWPPGYRELNDLVQEYGRDHVQAQLMSGQWLAFKVHLDTGDHEPSPATTWGVRRGRDWLEGGASGVVELPRPTKFGPPPRAAFWVLHYTVIVQISERPPCMDNPEDADGPKVRLAKELMAAAFPQGEWRQMGVRAVRKGCEEEAKTRRVQLPSPDTFSRAMRRRGK